MDTENKQYKVLIGHCGECNKSLYVGTTPIYEDPLLEGKVYYNCSCGKILHSFSYKYPSLDEQGSIFGF